MKKKPQIGFLLSNPDRIVDDALKLEKCGTENVPVCMDKKSGTVAATAKMVSFDFHGETYTPIMPIALSDTAMVKETILATIRRFEGNIWMKLTTEVTGQNLAYDIQHLGKAALSQITLDNGSEIVLERCCDMSTVTKYATILVDEVPELRYMDKTAAMANNPYPFVGNEATNNQTAEQLKTDFETALAALEVEFSDVEVMPLDNQMAYSVIYYAPTEIPVNVGQKSFENCGSEDVWTCDK